MPFESIITYEHSPLFFDNNSKDITLFNALVKFNDRHDGKFFRIGHKKITFNSYVGVMQVGNRIIEVLPKADNQPATPDTEHLWQRTLLHMLKVAGYIPINPASSANQHTRNINLMDIYLLTFLKEVEQLVHAGLIKKYVRTRSNLTALKGRIVIEKQILHNTIHKEYFFSEHTVYSRDSKHNQVLKAALETIRKISLNDLVKQEARKLLLYFEDVESWEGNIAQLQKITIDRKWKTYQSAMELAKLILSNYSPDLKAGGNHVIAIFFDMNLLFEKFIYRILKREEVNFKEQELHVSYHDSIGFWGNRYLQPDIILSYVRKKVGTEELETVKLVVDTKWKLTKEEGPASNDLKQMFAYNIQFNASHAILLYPSTGQHGVGVTNIFTKGLREINLEHSCETYFLDLFSACRSAIDELCANKFLHAVINAQRKRAG